MDAYIGEIRAVSFDYAPEGWMLCQGQTLGIAQYQVLYAVLGPAFGGDGRATFMLPNLNGTIVTQQGQGTGTQMRAFANRYGSESVVLNQPQMPSHSHSALAGLGPMASEKPAPASDEYLGHSAVTGAQGYAPGSSAVTPFAPDAVGLAGLNSPHENRQPFTVMNYIICVDDGVFPVRS